MATKIPTRRPGNHTTGYGNNEFQALKNTHLLAYPKRTIKIDHNGKSYFPVSVLFFLEGYQAPEFQTKVEEVKKGSAEYFLIEKGDMTIRPSKNKWIVELSAKESTNPQEEHMVKFELLLNSDWKANETLGLVVNSSWSLKNEGNKND